MRIERVIFFWSASLAHDFWVACVTCDKRVVDEAWLTQVYYLFKYFLYCYILSFFWVKKTLKKKKITSSYFTPLTHGMTHCWRPRIGIEWTDHCLLRWLIAGPKKNYRKYKSAHLVCSYHVLSLYGRLKWCGFDIILLPVDSEKRI